MLERVVPLNGPHSVSRLWDFASRVKPFECKDIKVSGNNIFEKMEKNSVQLTFSGTLKFFHQDLVT